MQRNGDPARASVVITLDLEADPVHGTLDMIVSVVRPIGHISAAPGFVEAPRVLDGASRLLVELFGEERGGHARMALYPPALPTHAPLTAELLLEIDEVVRHMIRLATEAGAGGMVPGERGLARHDESSTATSVARPHGSRDGLVAAADEARRRLERDLHDGAQQRFVLASLLLARTYGAARGTPAEPLVAEARAQVERGLAELRDLARGIHPAPLSTRGLAAALEGLVYRSPLPVELEVTRERAAATAEAAIYFAVAEALTNVAKHAHATRAVVRVDVDGETLSAHVADDGVGGADDNLGSGLRGLTDRLDALGGTLTVDSPPGGGTIIRARVPSRTPASVVR